MKNLSKFIFSMVLLMVFVLPLLSLAQTTTGTTPPPNTTGNTPPSSGQPSGQITIVNPLKKSDIKGLIETILNDILIPVGAVVAVLMVMYAGFLYVTAAGDPGKIKTAHQALTWAVIGAAILLGAWVISNAIKETIDTLRK